MIASSRWIALYEQVQYDDTKAQLRLGQYNYEYRT